MLNESLYNELQHNWNLWFWSWNDDDISFDWFGLQNATYCISSTNLYWLSNVQIVESDRPQENGWFVLNRYYRDKIINFNGSITADDEDWLLTAIDNIKWSLDWIEWYLQVKFGSTFRRIKATVSSIDIPRNHYNINHITFSISFLCKESFFSEIPMVETAFLWQTTSFQDEVINDWKAEVFTNTNVVFNSATSVTSFTMDIEWYSIIVTRSFVAGDVMVLNGETKSVTVNWTEVDYLGVFQPLKKEKNIVTFTITWTFNIDISILYKKSFK